MSDMVQSPIPLIEQLRAWFHPKDRSVQLAQNCWAFMHTTTTLPVDDLGRMPLSLVGIDEETLSIAATSVTFPAIPQIFRTLVLIALARTDRGALSDGLIWQANYDGGANYNLVTLVGQNTATASTNDFGTTSGRLGTINGNTARANNLAPVIAFWPGYRNTATEKSALSFFGAIEGAAAASSIVGVDFSHWQSLAAITALTFSPATGQNFAAGSVFSLYGIL